MMQHAQHVESQFPAPTQNLGSKVLKNTYDGVGVEQLVPKYSSGPKQGVLGSSQRHDK